jgi:hypothetical protein
MQSQQDVSGDGRDKYIIMIQARCKAGRQHGSMTECDYIHT